MTSLPFASVAAAAAELGIHELACLSPVPERLDSAGLDQLLADGVGDMQWLAEHRDLRLQPGSLLPGSRSLVVALLAHDPRPDRAPPSPHQTAQPQRARYAKGKDYHQVLRKRLAQLGRAIDDLAGGGTESRATVDSAPVNERSLARLAGLGWLGRNGLILHPKRGSYHHLGCLLTTAAIAAHHPGNDSDRCGSCQRCHQRCPTAALTGRRVLSERCISYLTIEHQGVIPRDLAERFEGWWFGCDLCQVACPWNRFAPDAEDQRLTGPGDPLETLLAVTAETFDHHFAGRAIRRAGYQRFRRNLLVASWSLGDLVTAGHLAREPIQLVRAQAAELGIAVDGTDLPSPQPPT